MGTGECPDVPTNGSTSQSKSYLPKSLTMKHALAIAGLLLILPSALLFVQSTDVGATVQTSSGPVTGHAAPNKTQVSEYLGIPFAQPPVGDLRFAAPQTYTSSKPLDASEYVSRMRRLKFQPAYTD